MRCAAPRAINGEREHRGGFRVSGAGLFFETIESRCDGLEELLVLRACVRTETEQLKAEGWKVVPAQIAQEPSAIVREDPPKQ